METERVTTDQLATGDLVLNSGMLIRLGSCSAAPCHRRDCRCTVYAFDGTVENMYEVFYPGSITQGLLGADGRWPVQGNHLALWYRVIETDGK